MSLIKSLTVGNIVRVHPESLPHSGRSTLVNAAVVSLGKMVTFRTLEDEFNPDTFHFQLEAEVAATLTTITAAEVAAGSTVWDRQHIAFVCPTSGRWLYGQAAGLSYPLLSKLRVKSGGAHLCRAAGGRRLTLHHGVSSGGCFAQERHNIGGRTWYRPF